MPPSGAHSSRPLPLSARKSPAHKLDYRRFLFINTELTVHLVREPAGEWVCLDAVTRPGTRGVGLTESVLWDESGRLGRAAQTLLVRPR